MILNIQSNEFDEYSKLTKKLYSYYRIFIVVFLLFMLVGSINGVHEAILTHDSIRAVAELFVLLFAIIVVTIIINILRKSISSITLSLDYCIIETWNGQKYKIRCTDFSLVNQDLGKKCTMIKYKSGTKEKKLYFWMKTTSNKNGTYFLNLHELGRVMKNARIVYYTTPK